MKYMYKEIKSFLIYNLWLKKYQVPLGDTDLVKDSPPPKIS